MANNSTIESFAARLEKLERENRRLRAALLAVLVLATSALLMGSQAETKPGPVKATSIGLYDQGGKLRGTISDKGLALFDEKGMRLSLGVEDGLGLTLLDKKCRRRVELLLAKEGPVLTFSDAADKQRVALVATADLSSLVLSDGNNRPGMTLGVGSNEGSSIVLTDKKGRRRAALAVSEGAPALVLTDENGKTRASLSSAKGKASLELRDDQGKVLFSKP
jgi:hypothetical protein